MYVSELANALDLFQGCASFCSANVGFTAQDRVVMGRRSKRVQELDVSGVVGSSHGWPAYYARPEIARSVAEHVYFLPAVSGTKSSTKEKADETRIR